MFERFTDQGRRVLVMAQEEARRLNHNYIGTEHLLLGLHREGDGVAVQVLVLLGADLNRLRQQVIQLLGAAQSPLLGAGQSPDVAGADADPARTRIDALDRRLAALEHWAGLRPDPAGLHQEIAQVRREKEAAIDRQDFDAAVDARGREQLLLAARADREKGQTQAAAGPPLAEELSQLKAELDRLRAILREHGIASGDDAEAG